MKQTKQKILDASRTLFNQYGVANVSQRTIATHLGISPGNLTYHFKKSEDIVEALYFELVASINEAMNTITTSAELAGIYHLIGQLVDRFFDYRFIFLDFVQIMRIHENIHHHYKQLCVFRKQQFRQVIQHLIAQRIMREEELPEEYDFLYARFQILSDFWLSSVAIRQNESTQEQVSIYKQILFQSVYPYLTNKGKKAFVNIA